MKNQYIHKKLKLAIVLNTMYWYNSGEYIAFGQTQAIKRVSKALAPYIDDIDVYQLYDYYTRVEGEIEGTNEY